MSDKTPFSLWNKEVDACTSLSTAREDKWVES